MCTHRRKQYTEFGAIDGCGHPLGVLECIPLDEGDYCKFHYLEDINKFLERHKLLKLIPEEINISIFKN